MKLQAVIFDLDQTLAPTQPLILAAFNYVLAKHLKQEMPAEAIIAAFGPTEEGILKNFLGVRYSARALEDFYLYYESHHRGIQPYPGIKQVLSLLSAHRLSRGILTGKGNRSTLYTLSSLGLLHSFEVIVTGDTVRRPKPHPEGLFQAMNSLKVSAEQTLMVGDAAADFATAKEAGARCWGAYWDVAEPETYHRSLPVRPDRFFTTVKDFHLALKNALSKG